MENHDGVSHGVLRVELAGAALDGGAIPIAEDGAVHHVRVVMGEEEKESAPRRERGSRRLPAAIEEHAGESEAERVRKAHGRCARQVRTPMCQK